MFCLDVLDISPMRSLMSQTFLVWLHSETISRSQNSNQTIQDFAWKKQAIDHFFKKLFTGQENFPGEIIHTQKWMPEQHDEMILDKKVVIIGSGSTAVTAFPAVAKVAQHVTLVQRTPTYIFSMPLEDKVGRIISDRCYK